MSDRDRAIDVATEAIYHQSGQEPGDASYAYKCAVAAVDAALESGALVTRTEVERLRDGIRKHRGVIDIDALSPADTDLWSLLGDDGG